MDYTPPTMEAYFVDIYIGAIKCFGTDDPGGIFDGGSGEDEPYLIVTAVSPASAFLNPGSQTVVRTWRSPTFEEIEGGRVFGENLMVFSDVGPIGPYGVGLKLVLMEHEHGNEEQLRREIQTKGDAIAREALTAAAALAGIPVDRAIEDQLLDTAIMRTIGTLSVDAITNILKDDKMGEKDWIIPAETMRKWVDEGLTDDSFFKGPAYQLPESVDWNFPFTDGPERLFSHGGGSYKVYLRIIPKKVIVTSDGRPV
jgi:hypothetical protein